MTVIDSPSPLTRADPAVAVAPGPRRAGYYGMLDAWRGVACLWVVCHHTIGFMERRDLAIAGKPAYAAALNGALGVWMFFVISGYCIANTAAHSLTHRRGGWVFSRVRRIFPPLWGSVLVAAASSLFAAYMVHRGILPKSNLANIDLPHQTATFFATNLTLTQELVYRAAHRPPQYLSGVYWTLCYEVGFYAVVALFLWVSRRHGDARRMLNGLHLVTAAALAALLIAPKSVPYPFDLWPHFGLGVLLFDVVANGWRRTTAIAASVILAGVVGYAVQHPTRLRVEDHLDYLNRGGGVSLAVAATFAVVLLGLHPFDARLSRTPGAKALGWVGLFSYSLYLTHTTFIGYVFKACQLGRLLPGYLPAYLVVTVGVCVGFAWVFFWICERPFLRTSTRPLVAAEVPGVGGAQARQSV